MKKLAYEEWEAFYQPVGNPIFPSPRGLFLPMGIELAFVHSLDRHLVWTLCREGAESYAVPGFIPGGHGYFVCRVAWHDPDLQVTGPHLDELP